MALTAAIATAVAAICAAFAGGFPALFLVLGLAVSVGHLAFRPERRGQPSWFGVRHLAWLTGAGALVVYLTGLAHSSTGMANIAAGALIAVLLLSLRWPDPAVLRYCLLLSAGAVIATTGSVETAAWPVAGLAVASALALVATNRLSAASVPVLTAAGRPAGTGPAGVRRRRVVGEAGILVAIAGLAGLLAAALLPPPGTGNRPQAGRRPSRPATTGAPYLQPADRLDAGGKGSGKGNQVVFRVSAPDAALWRTQTFGTWDGRMWRRAPAVDAGLDPRTRDQSGRFVFVPPGAGEENAAATGRFDQRITVEAGSIGLLPAASRPTTLQLPEGRVRLGGDGAILPLPSLGKGSRYLVTSFLPTADPDVLERADHDPVVSGVPTDVAGLYLGFPALPERVPGLAAEITAASPTSYAKTRALEAWLAANTEVVAGTPALAAGADPIDQFLLTRRGSSEQAATAMAVMLRSLGIPSRIAVGYLPGQRSPIGGDFVVRARDAHAWVEVWFPGVGWEAFDPAGRAPTPSNDSLLSRLHRLLGALWWLLAVAVVAGAAYGSWKALAWWRRRRARPWATRCYERLTRAGRQRDRPRQPAETPAEYCGALAADVPDDRLVRVGELLSVAAYSGREPPEDARAWADSVVRHVERSGPARRRRVRSGRGVPG